ncbi:unnamed protein product [Closterium sp. Naga37s-1]|nr:unnamed protein product [Closterium sp. Naga37s-1]
MDNPCVLASPKLDSPLLTSLELDSPFARRRPNIYRHATHNPLPPLHAFPSLHSLSLFIHTSKLKPPTRRSFLTSLTHCSSLTSLTLWNPAPPTLSSLASSSSSLTPTFKSLTPHSAKLQSFLSSLCRFPTLTPLSFLSYSIDPFELHTLSCSLHTLTHLTVHDCPLGRVTIATPDEDLDHTTKSSQGFHSLLHLSAPRLNALDLSRLPSFRPGMLVRVVQRGGEGGEGGEVGREEGGEGGEDFHFTRTTPEPTWLPPSLPSASPLMRLASARSAPSPLASSPSLSRSSSRLTPAIVSTISSLSAQPQLFESVALAAVFGRLKRLSLVSCFCLKEEQLVMLLHVCPLLLALTVERNEGFSDRVVARINLQMLTHLTKLECDAISADGIGGLLGSFPN